MGVFMGIKTLSMRKEFRSGLSKHFDLAPARMCFHGIIWGAAAQRFLEVLKQYNFFLCLGFRVEGLKVCRV
jgi:hypothetical protein